MRRWVRAGTHLSAALAGAGLIWAFSSGRRADPASLVAGPEHLGSPPGVRNREGHEESEDFRRMLDELAREPMSNRERRELRQTLLKSWAAKDPEGLLIWFEAQPWLPVRDRPALTELAWRNPDFLFRHAMERGDRGLLDTLVTGNPEAAMRLLSSMENADFLKHYIPRIFERGMEVDPAFVKELDRIGSPDLKAEAFVSASDTLSKSRDQSGLLDLWKSHPDLLNGKTLGDGLKMVSATAEESGGEILALAKMPSQQESGMERPVWLATLLSRLQGALLPGRGADEWQALVESSGCFAGLGTDEAARLLEISRKGGGSAEELASIAESWAWSEACSLTDIAALKDPALYDASIVAYMDRPDVSLRPGETWAEWISKISDPELRAGMEKKYLTPPEEDSDKDPFAASSEEH